MGIGTASGENRAAEAARAAVSSPLLETTIEGATGILLNITGGPEIGLFEVNEAAEVVTSAADQNANVIFGAVIDDAMGDEVRVTVIATGFGGGRRRRARAARARGAGAVARPSRAAAFEVPDEALDVPVVPPRRVTPQLAFPGGFGLAARGTSSGALKGLAATSVNPTTRSAAPAHPRMTPGRPRFGARARGLRGRH